VPPHPGPEASPPALGAPETTAASASGTVEERVVGILKTCFDPEIPVNIYDLGLIYEVRIEGAKAYVKMTLTSPMCPVAGTLPIEVRNKVQDVAGIEHAEVDLVWDPPWSPAKLSEAAKLQLGL
jgi:FeS assembly SUF system protein